MQTFLTGFKTHILALVAALGAFLHAMEWISQENFTTLIGILTPLVLMALRVGVSSVQAKVEQVQTAVVVQAAVVDAKLARVEQTVAQGAPRVVDTPPGPRPPWPRRAP